MKVYFNIFSLWSLSMFHFYAMDFQFRRRAGEGIGISNREGLFVIKFFIFRIKLNAIIHSEKLNRQCAVLGARERLLLLLFEK